MGISIDANSPIPLLRRYMKYLYPYECEKEKLSTPEELQMAIDGNRREGRRSSYGQYPELSGSSPPPTFPNRNHLFSSNNNGLHSSPLSLVSRQMNGHHSQGHSSGESFQTLTGFRKGLTIARTQVRKTTEVARPMHPTTRIIVTKMRHSILRLDAIAIL